MENLKVKTYADWNDGQYIEEYLTVGDIVDNEMYEHFLNVIPPLTFTSSLLQVREVYDYVDGRGVYFTLKKENGVWIYCGHCFRGETVNKIAK
ncbi:hypothetical protein [Clostridium disporicum]|uniref:hypothetical protein n=1 Tax=Clostridium disporicum TaxID=84024 RepID=UPI0034A5C137